MTPARVTAISFLIGASAWATSSASKPSSLGVFGETGARDAPGCSVSVVRGGKTVWSRAWGLANLEQPRPNRLDTVYEAGSVSKQFTAAAVAVLVAQGRVSLEDDVRKTLPELRDYGTPITVRHLLSHTSGVRNWDDLVELAGRPREDASGFRQADALAVIARQSELNFKPGSQYLYSNSNYVLAAVLVERVSGQSFQQFSAHELFGPAGMGATQWRDDYTRVVPGRATAYTPDDRGALHTDMPAEDVVGPGGLLTTVSDLQRWNALMAQPSAASKAWVDVLTSTRGSLADGTALHYGLGLEYDTLHDRPVISHAGATGGYRAYLARVPSESLSVAVLCNAGALNTEELGPRLVAAFLPSVTPTQPVANAERTVARDLAGRYRNTTTQTLVTATVDPTGLQLNGGAPFFDSTAGVLRNAEDTRSIAIHRGANGAVESLTVSRVGNSAVSLQRAEAWAPDAHALAEIQGTYFSADVGAAWTVSDDHGSLRATGPRGESFLLDPVYRDAFAARDAAWTVAVERDAGGVPDALRFYKTRTLGVRFDRVQRGAP